MHGDALASFSVTTRGRKQEKEGDIRILGKGEKGGEGRKGWGRRGKGKTAQWGEAFMYPKEIMSYKASFKLTTTYNRVANY